ncbi:imidazole glycerol phosphate synthase subunit HisH [Galbibacter sp. BG1]|uniref:imidazole glycerol phosphate synthase subunit HisH n=1 Tax=Galbibacter sp. BG1 TaxID=1170699 RepID=UPI0015BC0F88|nr:imidazole glycerol phosphate synthase subunit HisH [Galbibacter sp. BG1]QLE02755.1 imidazole glycerol phosphate synthase subunit HisH [Galbibacter sp. BG1]
MNITIIDYGAGNIQSIKFAFQRIGIDPLLSDDAETILKADKVIFPGVGEASSAMRKLKATGLDLLIPKLKQPVLGICLGMQLMCNGSEEGNTNGLQIFDVDVKRFSNQVKVPQIGWNTISNLKTELFDGISENEFMYLVHSYYAPVCADSIAISNYELDYSSALQKDNFYGTQFHPEKSSLAGQRVLENFLKLKVRTSKF